MILTPAVDGATRFLLRKDKYLFTPAEAVTIPAGEAAFYVTNDPVYVKNVAVKAEAYFRGKNPNLGEPEAFYGIGGPHGPPGRDRVLVFPVQ